MTRFHSAAARVDQTVMRTRGAVVSTWIRLWGGSVGPGLMVDRGVRFRHPPSRGWKIGDHVYLGTGAIIDVWPGAALRIGDRTKIMQYTILGVRSSLTIGADSQISEFSSVRDADHSTRAGILMTTATMVEEPVVIGDDVWIARGCGILRGSRVGDGSVIGANSVVRGEVPPMSIAVGAPAHVVKSRLPSAAEAGRGSVE